MRRPQKSCETREALSPLCIQSIDEQQEGMPIRIPSCLTPSAYQHVGKPQPFQEFFSVRSWKVRSSSSALISSHS